MQRTPEFDAWVKSHGGVFTRHKALELGVTAQRFRTKKKQDEWIPYRGVWRIANQPDSFESQTWAAVLRAGTGVRITAHSTLTQLGFPVPKHRVVLVIPRSRKIAGVHGIVLRDRCQDPSSMTIGKLKSVSRTRAIVDAIRVAPYKEAESILHEALRLKWVTSEALVSACKLLKSHKGLPQLRALTNYAQSGSQAESEKLLVRILKVNSLGKWEFNGEIRHSDGRLIGIGDAVRREFKIVIEVDGRAWHTAVDRFQHDRTRQNALVNAGWMVLRFTWEDVSERPSHVASIVRQALQNAEGRLRDMDRHQDGQLMLISTVSDHRAG